jgi:hypothetical protein
MSRIDVDPHGWGDAPVSNIEAVLKSTLECFETATGLAIAVDIRVKCLPGVPRTWYQPEPDGRIVVSLATQDRNWCQYVYQFSHELCHIATNYGSPQRSPEFGWLDEVICELASWTALRTLSNQWKVHPPFPNWKDYSSSIRKYRGETIDSYKKVADPKPLKQWFQSELPSLRANSIQREKNAKIGLAIMSYFYERGPGWSAAAKLNTWPVFPGTSVESFFADWMGATRESEPVLQGILKELI